MKRTLTIILLIIFTLGICVGCDSCIKEKEDCIPATLGKPEGLYLYYDNYRSLTDGTEEQTLLTQITIDGVIYTQDEFEIDRLEYVTATKEIVYSLSYTKDEEQAYCIYHYNYDTKESGLIIQTSLPATILHSDTHVYLRFGYNRLYSGILLDSNLNVLDDSFNGFFYFKDDYLYSFDFSKFVWWKNGIFHEIQTVNQNIDSRNVYVTGDYAYLFYDNTLFMVDMNTAEYKIHYFADKEVLKDWKGFFECEQKLYFISTSQISQTNLEHFPLETGCKLYCFEGLTLSHLYTFNTNYQVEFSKCSAFYLNFSIEQFIPITNDTRKFSAYYNIEKDLFVLGKTVTIEETKQNFKINGYEFYSSSTSYGPIFGSYRCYYLHRITDGKDEILLYHFDESRGEGINPVLFDDIYTK